VMENEKEGQAAIIEGGSYTRLGEKGDKGKGEEWEGWSAGHEGGQALWPVSQRHRGADGCRQGGTWPHVQPGPYPC
jgi:hypothetical protein